MCWAAFFVRRREENFLANTQNRVVRLPHEWGFMAVVAH